MDFAQDSPTQAWITDWVDFLSESLPLAFLAVVLLVGIVLLARSRDAISRVIGFAVGAALVFLLLTNLEAVAALFEQELPIGDG